MLARAFNRRARDVHALASMDEHETFIRKEEVADLRRRARENVLNGAVTSGYPLDAAHSVELLNAALATELVCTLRYFSHYYSADGLEYREIAEEFLEHAHEEQEHAMRIAERIKELNGTPDFNPAGLLPRSHSEFIEKNSLLENVREDLVAERIAIDSYRAMIRHFGDRDPASRRLMEKILAREEQHAEELASFLRGTGGEKASEEASAA
jgi:bacterioferritin